MSMHASRVIIRADGGVVFPGISYEGCKATVHTRVKDVVVIHFTGGLYWNGVGMDRAYAPARFQVIRLKGKGKKVKAGILYPAGDEFAFEYIVEFDIKKAKS